MEQIESSIPPGFRFHPTEEEVVGYYLYRKINSLKFDLNIISDIDLYRIEPWDIQEKCKLGYDEQNEWYFFSHKDRKYPTGSRTNRATRAGFWKATGRDKAVLSKNKMIGMRKTLVFYKGRAPNGKKTDWIIHEYRLQTTEHAPSQEEGWVVCRAFKKPTPIHNQGIFGAWNHHHNNNYYYNMRNNNNNNTNFHPHQNMQPFIDNFEREFASNKNNSLNNFIENELIMELPRLESPSSLSTSLQSGTINTEDYYDHKENNSNNNWENLDNLWGSCSNSSLFPNHINNLPSLQLVPHDCDDLEPHDNQLDNTFLGSFPNL